MLRTLTLALVLAITPIASAQERGEPSARETAQSYLEAYSALDLDRLATLYAESAEFNDPTSTHVEGIGGPFVWHGRDAILAGIRNWSRSIRSLHYEVERVYEASGRVVFIGAVYPEVDGPSGPVRYRYPIVTIVTIEDGLVTEHRDYTDYASGARAP
ncbi:MAG: nuclear transport factor 2 family protein [Hyphomonadaceae bacterium]